MILPVTNARRRETEQGETTMELVESPDRTRIAFDRSGAGPPLVVVLGTSSANT
jgi:hypothetical protein